MNNSFLQTANGLINLANVVQVVEDRDTSHFQMINGENISVDNRAIQNWKWDIASVIPDVSGLHQLIECYADNSDGIPRELYTEAYDVIGWKTVGEQTLPVAIGATHVFENPDRPYAILNTKTQTVRIIGGRAEGLESYDSLAGYQQAEFSKRGISVF